jgi:hypothetical protein
MVEPTPEPDFKNVIPDFGPCDAATDPSLHPEPTDSTECQDCKCDEK